MGSFRVGRRGDGAAIGTRSNRKAMSAIAPGRDQRAFKGVAEIAFTSAIAQIIALASHVNFPRPLECIWELTCTAEFTNPAMPTIQVTSGRARRTARLRKRR